MVHLHVQVSRILNNWYQLENMTKLILIKEECIFLLAIVYFNQLQNYDKKITFEKVADLARYMYL